MSDEITPRLNTAVDAILEQCLHGPKSPRSILGDCMDELANDPTWTKEDVEIVSQAVLRRLIERGR
jgi:hypothetical protein